MARQRYLASQKPTALLTELSGRRSSERLEIHSFIVKTVFDLDDLISCWKSDTSEELFIFFVSTYGVFIFFP